MVDSIDFIEFTEHFDTSMEFCARYGLPHRGASKLNTAPAAQRKMREDIPTATFRTIERRNEMDMYLYYHALNSRFKR